MGGDRTPPPAIENVSAFGLRLHMLMTHLCGKDALLRLYQDPSARLRLRQHVSSFSQELQIREASYKFVTCSEIWALFMSDDMLYSEPRNGTETSEEKAKREDAKMGAQNCPVLKFVKEKKKKEREIAQEQQQKAKEKKLAGDFVTGQTVVATHDISVRGKIAVKKGWEGVVQGPSLNHPQERLNVLFKERRDKKPQPQPTKPIEADSHCPVRSL
eukprot:s6157_g4.t1